MKTTIVPAQITTVEDKIFGNISPLQFLLIMAPVLAGGILYVVLPPFYAYSLYKVVFMTCLCVCCGVLAIRFRERILLSWLIILSAYYLRPQYFVLDKNDTHLRDLDLPTQNSSPEVTDAKVSKGRVMPRIQIDAAEKLQAQDLLMQPGTRLQIKPNKKGGYSVFISKTR
jgi:hypothetical protein